MLPFLDGECVWLALLPAILFYRPANGTCWTGRTCLQSSSTPLGTVIHFTADLQKKRFKAKPEMKGVLLDQGLWRYSRHPNYFGDLLVYIGWALFAANPWAWLSPAVNLAQYAFDAIPKNEKWAAERYGQSLVRLCIPAQAASIPWVESPPCGCSRCPKANPPLCALCV